MLLVTLWPACAQAEAKHKPRDPGDIRWVVPHVVDSGVTRVKGACINFHGSFSDTWHEILAGDYFSRLERAETPQGPVFRMGSEVVANFPDQVYIRAYAGVSRCSKDLKGLGPWPTVLPELARGVRAEAAYVRDLHRYPLEINEVEDALAFCWVLPLEQRPTWYYLWLVKTKGVRLTDTLIVDLFSKDGASVGRFTIKLAAPRSGIPSE
jgi:hypothetical protein